MPSSEILTGFRPKNNNVKILLLGMLEKQKIIKYVLVILTGLFSFLAWSSVSRGINIPTSSIWGAPILWFSLFFISLSLSCVLIKRLAFIELVAGAAFSISLFFVFIAGGIFWHALIIFTGFLLASWGIGRIRQDLQLNIKIDLRKTLKTGSTFLILAFSLIIASQYYWETKNASLESILPNFQIDALSEKMTSRILSSINPDFKNLSEEDITVDQFILENGKEQLGGNFALGGIGNELLESGQALVLEEGRRQFSDLAGIKLSGQEKLSTVFSSIVNNRINDFIAPSFSDRSQRPLLHLILAFVLFLTVVSLGSLLSVFLISLIKLIFWIFRKTDLVEVIKTLKEVEEIN